MKYLSIVFAIVFSCSSEAQQVFPLYYKPAPGSLPIKDIEAFSRPETGLPVGGDISDPTLTISIPEYQNASRSAVIVCPGGTYLDLSIQDGSHQVAKELASTGMNPAFTLLINPVTSFNDSLTSRNSKTRNTLLDKRAKFADQFNYSPELHVTAATSPALIAQAENDSTFLVENSITLYKSLVANQVPVQLMNYKKGGHGFAWYNKPQEEYRMPAAIKWLSHNGPYESDNDSIVLPDAPAFWNDIVAFKREDENRPPPPNPILFVGSSSFTRWSDIKNAFPGYPVMNRAFGGSVLVDVIRYAYDIILPYRPKQVVIYCGENDIASSDTISVDEVVLRFKTLFGIIRQNLPATTISFVSVKPSPVRAKYQDKVKAANKEIKAFLKTQKRADFINVYDAMLATDGKMRETLYVEDRLHMKPEGYAIWQKIIAPYLIK